MPEIDPVILELRADLKQYRTDLNGAQRLTETKLAAIEARGVAMGHNLRKGFDLAKGAALGFVASLGIDAVVQAAQKGLEYASSLGEVAQQLGVTTGALQEYRYAASQAGLSQEEIDQALSQLTRRLGEAASGTKAQAEAFTKLGISVKDANGNVIDAGNAIPQIADALQKIESPAERAAILMDLFGRAGQKLEPLLSGGSAAVNELREAAHKLGLVLSEDQIQRADETADKLSALKQVLEARIAGAVADNANAILGLANALASVVEWAGKAFNAYRRFKLEQGLRLNQNAANGWFTSEEQKAQAQRNATRFQYELDRMDGKPVGFGTKGIDALLAKTPSVAAGTVGAAAGGSPASSKTSGSSDSGPSSAEILARIDGQLASMAQQALSAMESVAKSADERAELELRSVELARVRALREVDTDTDLDRLGKEEAANQRARLKGQIESLADAERARVEERRKAELEQDARDLAQERYSNDRDALQVQYDLADSQSERRRLALDMLDLELRYQKALLEAVIASETATAAEKERARVALEGVNATAGGKRDAASRANESPLEAYRRKLNRSPEAIQDDVESYVVDELNNVRDGIRGALEKAIGTDDPLISGLLNLLIEQVILRPLADALANASGGGGGGIGGALTSIGAAIFGRASGGYVNGGQMYRVNEGAGSGRVEGFIPQGAGHIVPLGKMNALKSQRGGNVYNITVDHRNSVTPDGFAQDLSSQILRQAAQMDGQTAQAVVKAMPQRMGQYQRDGF